MDINEVRDALARVMGWTYGRCPAGRGFDHIKDPCWHRPSEPGVATVLYHSHPIPPTLTAAAACLPDDCRWGSMTWHRDMVTCAVACPTTIVCGAAPDEMLARFRAALAAWIARGEG